ncbi:tumor necrosis factor receptor superfamily member 10B-like isoform X1 [Pteropus medius]|uniref:tumor necrosis factor receptor superfamily member 10B-like isoform X1 n=1 Tax=Pteropus vampyrus TaxID=132908 RepID=UPI00196ABB06|nr:tumor necrosis factor receptor superfamily member 10B-like isoform X1 [Pteropus giganteus]
MVAPGRLQGPPRRMEYARSLMTLPGPGALPDRTGQRGHSALASSGARAGRAPVARPVPGAGPRLGGPRALISVVFVVFALLLAVPAASAITTGQDRVHQQLTAPQGRRWSLTNWCPPGSHVSEDDKECINCTDEVDYTIHWNQLSSCLPCTTCKSGKEEIAPCTRTKDTQCQCKPGTYQGEESPEFCQKCSTECPDGMVQAKPCTPWSNLKCVKRESGTENSGEVPVPGEPVPTRPGLPSAPSPSSGNSQLVTGVIGGVVAFFLCILLLFCACCHRRPILQACGVDPKRVDRVFSWCSCPRRGPGARDNAHNEIVSNRNSQSTLVSEQELEQQEHAELAHVIVQSPGEAMRLLAPAEAEESQKRSKKLVPANDTDPIDSLRQLFDYLPNIVPYNSWNPLMRLMGLKDNDIHVARARASDPKEAFHEMLVTWLNNTGKAASVNTLLVALETLEERNAKETIEDYLVKSGMFVCEEDGTGSAVS